MTRVVLSTVRLVEFLEGGGHFWVYMQYVDALRRLGCEVVVLDSFVWADEAPPGQLVRELERRLDRHGVERSVVMAANAQSARSESAHRYVGVSECEARDLIQGSDLLLNFNYGLARDVVSLPKRSALVDIDPGLCQFWISRGYISPAAHDLYFTTGETVGLQSELIPDCGIDWISIRAPVSLRLWPYSYDPGAEAFTTVSSWWAERDYVGDAGSYYDNTKRTAFFPFIDLPLSTEQPLELALYLAETDGDDRRMLEDRGWRVRHTREVGADPDAYRSYIQGSRGEFSWAKRSCLEFQNAWVSDRSLCYLASGRPVVVQDTGQSSILPTGEGMFRFKTLADAARALELVNDDYERHCRLARLLVEEHFDAKKIVHGILEKAL
jgi:hypothetical protein